ncbi:MAG: histone deacetylase family protein [Pseudomonadota bacterium]
MATLLLTHKDADGHQNPDGHPEQVARLDYVRQALEAPEFKDLIRADAPMGTDEMIALAHPERYIDRIKRVAPSEGLVAIDGDTSLVPGTLAAAYRGVGGAVMAVDQVMEGKVNDAFLAMRPPGHHAEKETAMGFCIFGNVAIAAKYALRHHGLGRVAIVDFDVHHGNGTEDLVKSDDRILFISSHQMPLYPGTGYPSEIGPHRTIVNVPFGASTKGVYMRETYEAVVFPRIREFKPDLLLVSAGFDAHAADPLANLMWLEEDFAWLGRELKTLAKDLCDGRMVSVLEGGYNLEALGASVASYISSIMDEPK